MMQNHTRALFILFLLVGAGILGALGHAATVGTYSTEAETPTSYSASQSSTPVVHVEPQNVTGNFFTISVNVTDVMNLYGFTIRFAWGSQVLGYVSKEAKLGTPGWLLYPSVLKIKDEVDEAAGTYTLSAQSLLPAPSFNGSGWAFKITFELLREGECWLYLHSTDLWNKSASPIAHSKQDGYFYWPGKGSVPEAEFTFNPQSPYTHIVANRTTIVFDASASYDPDAGGGISEYHWNFGDGATVTTSNPTTTHTYFAPPPLPERGPWTYLVSMSTSDIEGSQSKTRYRTVSVVHPRPVASFEISQNISIVGQNIAFDAAESYDPDPPELGGGITQYRWTFGDGDEITTTGSIVYHNYSKFGQFSPRLTVVDTEGFESDPADEIVNIAASRDIDVAAVEVSPTELPRGAEALVKATIINRGDAEETFNVTAYYNQTAVNWIDFSATQWAKIDELSVTVNASLHPLTRYLLSKPGTSNAIDCRLGEYLEIGEAAGQVPTSTDTRVKVGDTTGYWTINPNKTNDAASSPSIISGTPLSTGGWIRDKAEKEKDPAPLTGDFAEGNWTFKVRLFATETGVTVTVWIRILKSNNPNPQAPGASVTVIRDWTQLFEAASLPTTVKTFNGTIALPIIAFEQEYLYIEYQLQASANTSGQTTTEVVFQINDYEALILTTPFTLEQDKKTLTFHWDTVAVTPERYYWILVNATRVPQEVKPTNNIKLSDEPVHLTLGTPIALFDHSPTRPIVDESVRFDASASSDPNGYITEYIWDFGDGTLKQTTEPYTAHAYSRPGTFNVTLRVIDNDGLEGSRTRWVEVSVSYTLDVIVDVGAIHFGGEIAEFYILVVRSGERINATEITAVLYHSNGAMFEDLSNNKQLIATGLYRVHFNIDPNAPSGTYTLLLEANYLNLKGTALKSFLISNKLTGWDALLRDIKDEIATIVIPSLREIKANLTEIKATLVRIEEGMGVINSTLGEIKTYLTAINATLTDIIVTKEGNLLAQITYHLGTQGTITAELEDINAKVVEIDGSLSTIQTDVGSIKTKTSDIQATAITPLYVASIFSATATILTVIILLVLRRKPGKTA